MTQFSGADRKRASVEAIALDIALDLGQYEVADRIVPEYALASFRAGTGELRFDELVIGWQVGLVDVVPGAEKDNEA